MADDTSERTAREGSGVRAGRVRRIELVWPGKYEPRPEPLDSPRFEVEEIYDPSVIVRAPGADPRAPSSEGEWQNMLVRGENMAAMRWLFERFGGAIDLVYIDPPFATGRKFRFVTRIGEGDRSTRRIRAQPSITGAAYEDRWSRDPAEYLSMLRERLLAMKALLAPEGTIFVHLDRRAAHPVKLVLDEIFGEERLINEIVWCYTGPSSPGMRGFANKHDTIFWYANGSKWTFEVDAVRLPYKPSTVRNEGRRTGFTTGNPSLVVKLHPRGKYPEDWWVLPVEAPASRRRTAYPTQKPERLLERVLLAASRRGDLVADFFSGSGTTLAVAERLGRRWIGCDASAAAIHVTRKRLLALQRSAPFCVLGSPGSAVEAHGTPRVPVRARAVEGGRVIVALEDEAKDSVDFWAVGPDSPGGPFRPVFAAFRTEKSRELALESPPLDPSLLGGSIAVKLIDGLGAESTARLSVKRAQSSSSMPS